MGGLLRWIAVRCALACTVAAPPAVAAANPRGFVRPAYVACQEFLDAYATTHSAADGWVSAAALKRGDWVIIERHGLAEVEGPGTEGRWILRLPGRRVATTEVPLGPDSRIAYLGTRGARELTRERIRRAFPRSENLDLFFMNRALSGFRRNASHIDWPVQKTLEEIWKRVSEDSATWKGKSLDELSHLLSLNFQGTQGWDNAAVFSGPEALSTIRRFVHEVYDATGVNLVQTGILEEKIEHWNNDGTMGLMMFGGSSATHVANTPVAVGLPRPPSLLLGGGLDRVPLDVLYELVVEQWRNSERDLEARGRGVVWASEYVPGAAGDAHAPTVAVRRFKETGAIAEARPALEPAAGNKVFGTLKERLAAAGDEVLYVPMPGSDGTNRAPAALAAWLRGEVGAGKVQEAIHLLGDAESQKAQSSLWARIRNVQNRGYRIDGTVRGKVIVLVDDVITSGVTTQMLKKRLLEAGAQAVYVFSLAKTGREAAQEPRELLDLSRVATAAAKGGGDMPAESVDFAPWVQEWLRTGEPLPWMKATGEGRSPAAALQRGLFASRLASWIGERLRAKEPVPWAGKASRFMTPTEQVAKVAFEKGFESRDLLFMSRLSPEALEQLDGKGRPVPSGRPGLAKELATDDIPLAELARKLYEARGDSSFTTLRDSPFGRLVLTASKARMAAPGVFRNQLSGRTELMAWLEAQ